VAKASSVSEVEVSPSIVTALNVSSTPLLSRACRAAGAIGASVKMKDSIVAMSGAIMPAPLAMPLMVTLALPSLTVAVATFGKVSVVMIALARPDNRRARLLGEPAEHAVELGRVQRLADHAGRGQENLALAAPDRFGSDLRSQRGGAAAGLAGEGVGIAGIDDQRAALPPFSLRGTIRPARTGISTW
jgi:hypothetical protein